MSNIELTTTSEETLENIAAALRTPFLVDDKIDPANFPSVFLVQVRQGSKAELNAANPPLAVNEPAYETDTLKFRLGSLYPGDVYDSGLYVISVYARGTSIQNGAALKSAYAKAKIMLASLPTSAWGPDRKITILVYPGSYDLGATSGQIGLTMDTSGIVISGVGNPNHTYIYSYGRTIAINNTLSEFGINNVRLITFSGTATDAAFWLSASQADGQFSMNNCAVEALGIGSASMRKDVIYSGKYNRCILGVDSLGSGSGGQFSGEITDSIVAGGLGSGGNGIVGGILTRVTCLNIPASSSNARLLYCNTPAGGTIGARSGGAKAKFCIAGTAVDVHDA